jgi:hypothetical protein
MGAGSLWLGNRRGYRIGYQGGNSVVVQLQLSHSGFAMDGELMLVVSLNLC